MDVAEGYRLVRDDARLVIATLRSSAFAQRPAVQKADYKIGWWLSAALEDPAVCEEMKADINAWFEAHQPGLVMSVSDTSTSQNTDRNWTEDAAHENGNYECRCVECGNSFIGHKRRVLCKLCSNLLSLADTSPVRPEGGK
jgi:hypothetical protein